jgi:hypothetical protein
MPLALNFFQKQTQNSIFILNVIFEVALTYYKFVCLNLKDIPHNAVSKTKSIVC